MQGFAVRPAEPGEYATAGRICVAAYGADGQLEGDHGYDVELADVAARAKVAEVLVAVEPAGAILGTVTFVPPGSKLAEHAGPDEAEFRMLAVAPDAQGRGVGSALVRACVARAEALGVRAIAIYTRDFATTAHRLYEKHGFVRVPDKDWHPVPTVRLWALRLDLTAAR